MIDISKYNLIKENIDYIRIPFDILNTGISPDSIIENQRNMSKETVCSICLDIVYDPVMCGNCENLFCRHCINIQLEKSCTCPNKCIFEEKPINRVLKNLLNKFETESRKDTAVTSVPIPTSVICSSVSRSSLQRVWIRENTKRRSRNSTNCISNQKRIRKS